MKTVQFHSKVMRDLSTASVAGKEGARRATGVPATDGNHRFNTFPPPDPEVPEKKPGRRFTAAYKPRILQEYDACRKPGEIGALLRREGLYHSNVSTWRRQRDQGALHGLTPKKRGRKAGKPDPMARKVARLERENKRLAEKLKKAETIIEFQKKISEILGIPQKNSGEIE